MANAKNPQLKHEFNILEILNRPDPGEASTYYLLKQILLAFQKYMISIRWRVSAIT